LPGLLGAGPAPGNDPKGQVTLFRLYD
jgi:hypothetical protein